MRLIAIGTISLLTSLPSALAGAPEGKATFAAKCQSCHGPNGEGKPAIAKMMRVTILPLGSKEVQCKTDADLMKIITMGQGKMRRVAGLSDIEAADLVAFMRSMDLSGGSVVRNGENEVKKEIERIESDGAALPLPTPLVSDYVGSVWKVSRTLDNRTGYELVVLITGPVDKKIVLAAGTKQVFEIPPGRYKVAARLLAPDFPPLFGVQEYVSGHDYKSDFVIE